MSTIWPACRTADVKGRAGVKNVGLGLGVSQNWVTLLALDPLILSRNFSKPLISKHLTSLNSHFSINIQTRTSPLTYKLTGGSRNRVPEVLKLNWHTHIWRGAWGSALSTAHETAASRAIIWNCPQVRTGTQYSFNRRWVRSASLPPNHSLRLQILTVHPHQKDPELCHQWSKGSNDYF